MAFIKAGKNTKSSGNQNPPIPEEGASELNSLEKMRPPVTDPYSTVMNYFGDKFIITIKPESQINIVQPQLSVREAEVLQCLAVGLSSDQTAQKMNIKPRMVRKHLENLTKKFKTDSRDQLMARAGYLRLCNPYKDID